MGDAGGEEEDEEEEEEEESDVQAKGLFEFLFNDISAVHETRFLFRPQVFFHTW